jgi:predicted porin
VRYRADVSSASFHTGDKDDMKIQTAILAGLMLVTQGAFAQSSVTLYGIADVALRFATNQPTSAGPANRLFLTDGATTFSRWGLKGLEDIGGGTSAIFDLESGYSLTNGASGQQGQLFGPMAYVGLSNSTYGTLTLGRQYGTAHKFNANFDPISNGNVTPDDWEGKLLGVWFDNSAEYSNNLGPVYVELQYSFGNQAGSVSSGSTIAADAIYSHGGFRGGVVGQTSKDGFGHSLYGGSLGASYTFGPAKLESYYIYARRDAGFTVSANNSGLPLANTVLIGNAHTATGTQTAARTDHLALLGGTYTVTPSVLLTLAGMYDWTTNVAPGQSGRTASVYGIADYLLSRRTDVYLEADYSHLSGAAVSDPNSPIGTFAGKSASIGTMVGVRTRF